MEMDASNSRQDVQRSRRARPERTRCLRGHEFTPHNTQWVNARKVGQDGSETTTRSRLCRICSRARARRYLDKQPRKKAEPLPSLPTGSVCELELEMYIRRIVRARAPMRAKEFWGEVQSRLEHHGFQVKSEPHRVPIRQLPLQKEEWTEYAERTKAGWSNYGDWFVGRMLDDPRIQSVLNKALSRYAIVELGKVNPRRVRLRRLSQRPWISWTRPRLRNAARP